MKQYYSLFAALVIVSLLNLNVASANTLGIDEVTSLRSTDHNVLEANGASAESALAGSESSKLAHWLVINETTKWQFDNEVLTLNENFFNTNYDAVANQAVQATETEAGTLALFYNVQDAKYNGNAQNATAKN